MKKLRKPKTAPADQWLSDIPDPYRHCLHCKHHKPKEHPFGLCKKGLRQADDERCEKYRANCENKDNLFQS